MSKKGVVIKCVSSCSEICEKPKINDYHRLTEKEYDGYKLIKFFPGNTGDLAIQKLGQLEDLLENHKILSLDDLDKRLTALEIIKEKEYLLKGLRGITQEDFDLIKEVLL